MNQDATSKRPETPSLALTPNDARKERLAAALRDNLKRRKAQLRSKARAATTREDAENNTD